VFVHTKQIYISKIITIYLCCQFYPLITIPADRAPCVFTALVERFFFFLEKNEHVATVPDIYPNELILNQDRNRIAVN